MTLQQEATVTGTEKKIQSWLKGCRQLISEFPVAGVILGAGFASLLRTEIAGIDAHIVHIYGLNCSGKTLTARLAVHLGSSAYYAANSDQGARYWSDPNAAAPSLGLDDFGVSDQPSRLLYRIQKQLLSLRLAPRAMTLFTTSSAGLLPRLKNESEPVLSDMDARLVEIDLSSHLSLRLYGSLPDSIRTLTGHGYSLLRNVLATSAPLVRAQYVRQQHCLEALFTTAPSKGRILAAVEAGITCMAHALQLEPAVLNDVRRAYAIVLDSQYASYLTHVKNPHPAAVLDSRAPGLSQTLAVGTAMDCTTSELVALIERTLFTPADTKPAVPLPGDVHTF